MGRPTEAWATGNNVTHPFRGPSFEEPTVAAGAGTTVVRLELYSGGSAR